MKLLVIDTLPKENTQANEAIRELQTKEPDCEVVYANELNIHYCVGCNNCWLKTPGKCSIKDDYEQHILLKIIKAEKVIFIDQTNLGFVSYKMKNILDRVLPLATMYLEFSDNQMRHIARYNKECKSGLIYIGEADNDFINHWMYRVMRNLSGKSLGAFEIGNIKEALQCI